MSIWFFIMLIVACALVLGPISMLRPNPAQKRKEQLRLYASKKGLRFSMRRLPALKTDTDQPMATPVYYLPPQSKTLEVPEWILMRTRYTHEGNFYSEWDWQSAVRPKGVTCDLLKTYLPRLPESVSAISHGGLGVCVFWSENEGVETLDLLIEMLSELNQVESTLAN
ncbi:MAG TPA: hypothetical protein DIW64_10880 [Cellvibrio sp.]|nr:hypothetical protein [Cellvibrio sp.]